MLDDEVAQLAGVDDRKKMRRIGRLLVTDTTTADELVQLSYSDPVLTPAHPVIAKLTRMQLAPPVRPSPGPRTGGGWVVEGLTRAHCVSRRRGYAGRGRTPARV